MALEVITATTIIMNTEPVAAAALCVCVCVVRCRRRCFVCLPPGVCRRRQYRSRMDGKGEKEYMAGSEKAIFKRNLRGALDARDCGGLPTLGDIFGWPPIKRSDYTRAAGESAHTVSSDELSGSPASPVVDTQTNTSDRSWIYDDPTGLCVSVCR